MSRSFAQLGLTWRDALLVDITAVVIYVVFVVLSRIFGQRQFSTSTSYDLAFIFALGTLIGRVILVRTSLAAGVIGLTTMFVAHTAAGRLYRSVPGIRDLLQNKPVLLTIDGRLLEVNMRRAGMSRVELYQALRQHGFGSLEHVGAAVLERDGRVSVVDCDRARDRELLGEVGATTMD